MRQRERAKSLDNNVLDFEDFFMTRSAFIKKFREEHAVKPPAQDYVDAEINRRIGEIEPSQASILDGIFAIGAIGTFIADITTDVLVAKQHYENNDMAWFALTCIFIVLPSFVMQIFSCKWFYEDYLNQSWWTYILHLLQLGTIERYLLAFWYGFRTRHVKPVNHSDYIRYLTEWRDVTLLRLFEGFLEAAPQMILQLYILTIQNEFIIERDWLTATSAVVSIISLSWAIVSYSQMLRICLNSKVLSVFGYCFQICYRLLMVASRVVVLVLFASAFRYYIFVFIFSHCAAMFGWLCCMDMITFSANGERNEPFLEKIFTLIVSVIYLFCFLNIHPSTTKRQISIYYSVMFFESAVLMAVWFPYRTLHGVLMYAAFGLVFGGFLLGMLFMLLYYKYFHPNQDITAGWFCCAFFSRRSTDSGFPIIDDASLSIVENGEFVVINPKETGMEKARASKPPTPSTPHDNRLSIPLEIIRPHSPSKSEKGFNVLEQAKIDDVTKRPGDYTTYGTIQSASSPREDSRQCVRDECEMQKSHDCRGTSERQLRQAENGGFVARINVSKQKDFGRLYQESGIIENKAELGNIQFGQDRASGLGGKSERKSLRREKDTKGELNSRFLREDSLKEKQLLLDKKTRDNSNFNSRMERQQSRDDAEIGFCSSTQSKIDRKRRKSLNDKEVARANLSARALDHVISGENYEVQVQKRNVFSDTNLNDVEWESNVA